MKAFRDEDRREIKPSLSTIRLLAFLVLTEQSAYRAKRLDPVCVGNGESMGVMGLYSRTSVFRKRGYGPRLVQGVVMCHENGFGSLIA